MKEQLIKLGFEKWLSNLDVAPYPVIFWDIPLFIQISYIQKWLREVHNIIVTSKPYQDDVSNETDEDIEFQTLWENEIVNVKDSYNTFSDNTFHHSYEEALEVGLQEALKLI